jgi:HSP20 family protein
MLPVLRNNLSMTPWTATPINRIERLFDRFFDDGFAGWAPGAEWTGVPVSMWQDDEHLYVEAELPGMTEQDVDVTVHNGILFIRGERKPAEGRQYLYDGRTYGRFERAITLPEAVDADAVQAELTCGVLRLVLPKRPEAKPKKIALKTS